MATHLAGAHLAAATTVQAPTSPEPAVLSELLDDASMAAFVRDGFVAFHLDGMPAEWHESVAADAQAASEASPGDQSAIWSALAPKMDSVVKAPRFQGVMRSLAGPDYMMTPSGHMHVSATAGQSFHKDGTGHGVRTHDSEEFIIMYYPTETELQMGPTVIIPGSHYFSPDRAGHWTSEDHIQTAAVPPNPDRPRTQLRASEEEMDALRAQGQASSAAQKAFTDAHSAEEQDAAHFAESVALLGEGFYAVPMAVPAGTVCVVDADLAHRAGRAALDARWRPMLKLSVRRVSAPESASWSHDESVTQIPVDTSGSDGAGAVWQQHWSRLCGTHSPSAEVDVAALVAVMEEGKAEPGRQGAGYELGAAISSRAAADALLARFDTHPAERVRRAAAYGLTIRVSIEAETGGGPTTDALIEKLEEDFVPALGAVSGTPAVVHALAEAAPSEEVVSALERCWERTMAETEAYCAAAVAANEETLIAPSDGQAWRYQTKVPIDFYITDRRNTLTELLHAVGSVGCAAARDGNAALATRAAALILQGVALVEEPGSIFPSYARVNLVRSASASNLIKLLSSARNRPSLGPRADAPREESHGAAPKSHAAHADPQFQSDLLAEAIRRGHEAIASAEGDEAKARAAMLELVERQLGDGLTSRYTAL